MFLVSGPLLAKNNQCPSGDNSGVNSPAVVLMFGPRFWAGAQSALRFDLCATQRSNSPKPPGRSDTKKIVSRSDEIAVCRSWSVVLMDGPMLTGVDQAENCGAASEARASKASEMPARLTPNFFSAPRRVTDWARPLASSSNLSFITFLRFGLL